MGMQGGGKVGGRHYVALLMSLLLMMAAWQTLAVAAEGDADVEAVSAEEVVPEVDEAVETDGAVKTDEAAATVDEEAASEQDVQAEDTQEPAESDQVEEEVATEAAAPETEAEEQAGDHAEQVDVDDQADGALQVQSSESELSFADGAIRVENLLEGEVTYDKESNTLTLNAARMGYLDINTSVTIELVGNSRIENSITIVGEGMTLSFEGSGKLSYDKDLIAGRVGNYDDDYYYYYDNSVQPTGDVIVKGGTLDCTKIHCKDFSISGGTVCCGVIAGQCDYNDQGEEVYSGTVTMTGGSIEGYVNAETVTLKGGSVSGGVECTTFRMYEGAKISAKGYDGGVQPLIRCTTFAMWGGTITLTNCCEGISASEKFSLAGGTITIKGTSDMSWNRFAIEAGASFYMKGGTITTSNYSKAVSTKTVTIGGGSVSGNIDNYYDEVSSFTMSGGTVKGDVYAKAVTMSKGTITGKVECAGTMKLSGGTISTGSDDLYGVSAATLSMTGGTIKVSKCYQGIVVSKSFAMSKGTIAIASCDYGISAEQYANTKTANITIKGGKVTITNPSETGIEAAKGNITMTGGTVSVTGSYGDALYAYGTTYRGTKYGGRIKVTGGKLTAKVRKPSQNSALLASYGVSNKATCLGSIAGQVSKGTSFKVGGNTYKVSDYSDVRLTKYESSKTSTTLTTVKFGSRNYSVVGVATNAFATTQGKKLKSLSFGYTATYLGSDAFKGTSSLTSLRLQLCTTEKWTGTTCKVSKMKGLGSYAKTAFRGAGKNSGKGLTVRCGSGDARTAYRAYLRTLGLPSGAKVVGYRD